MRRIRCLPCHTGRLRRPSTLAAAVLLGVSSLVLASGAGASTPDPSAGTALTPSTASTLDDQLEPLAGSATTLVYLRSTSIAAGVGRTSPGATDQFTARIVARSSAGSERTVAAMTDDVTGWSLAGTTLTVRVDDPRSGEPTGDVDYWDVTSLAHGRITLAAGESYLSAGPGGAVVVRAGQLYLHPVQGSETSLGTPFAPTAALTSAAVGAGRLLVTSSTGAVALESFAHPGAFTHLAAGTGAPVVCTGLSGTDAACANAQRLDTGWAPDGGIRVVPLDGSAPTVAGSIPDHGCQGSPVVAGDTVYWNDPCRAADASVGEPADSVQAGSAAVTAYPTLIAPDLVAALGRVVADAASHAAIVEVDTSATVLVPARRSPVTAGAFQLATGRIVYTDDQPLNGARAAVLDRSVSTSAQSLTVGTPAPVYAGTGDDEIDARFVGASGSLTVWARPDLSTEYSELALTVVGPRSTTVLGSVQPGRIVVSGNRLVFRRGGHFQTYDAASGVLTDLSSLQNATDVTVWGNYIVWGTIHGGVYRRTIGTSTDITVAPPGPSVGNRTYVWEYADYVGWHIDGPAGQNRFRDVATTGATVLLPHTLWSMTSAGALMDLDPDQQAELGPAIDRPTPFLLQTYGGATRTVLPTGTFLAGVQLVGRTMAWIDGQGVLRASGLASTDVPRPRYLSAYYAPVHLTPAPATAWPLQVPYSQPLASCSVVISRAGRTVRTLACSAAAAGTGIASVRWDGSTSGGSTAAAGTYTWTVHATGSGGYAALNSGGQSVPVSGTVEVT